MKKSVLQSCCISGSHGNYQYLCIAQKCQLYKKCCYSCAQSKHRNHQKIAYFSEQLSNLFGKNKKNKQTSYGSIQQKLYACKLFFQQEKQKLKYEFQCLIYDLDQTFVDLFYPLKVLESTISENMGKQKFAMIRQASSKIQLQKIAKQLRDLKIINQKNAKWMHIMMESLNENFKQLQIKLSQDVEQIKEQLKQFRRLSQFGSGMQESIKDYLYNQYSPRSKISYVAEEEIIQEGDSNRYVQQDYQDDSNNDDVFINKKEKNQNQIDIDVYRFIYNAPGVKKSKQVVSVDINGRIADLGIQIQYKSKRRVQKIDWKITQKAIVTSSYGDESILIKDFIQQNNIQAINEKIELLIKYSDIV